MVDLLLRGAGDAAAADQLGVDRGTVFRWRTQHAGFRAELERQRELAFQESVDRLRSMVQPALDIIQRQMGDTTDPRTALRAAAILLRFAAPRRPTTGAASAGAGGSSHAHAAPAATDTWDLIEAYVNAPMPGQPGAPEELARTLSPADDDDDGLDDDDDDTSDPPDEGRHA